MIDVGRPCGYQNDGQCVALNRSLQEDELESLNESQLKQLLGDLPYHVVDDRAGAVASLANEIWRLFVVGMIVALLLEARLTLPSFIGNTSSTREQKIPMREVLDEIRSIVFKPDFLCGIADRWATFAWIAWQRSGFAWRVLVWKRFACC